MTERCSSHRLFDDFVHNFTIFFRPIVLLHTARSAPPKVFFRDKRQNPDLRLLAPDMRGQSAKDVDFVVAAIPQEVGKKSGLVAVIQPVMLVADFAETVIAV